MIRVASYNMHKGVGTDRRFDPDRILAVLHEVRADVVALQECDARLGKRASLLPHAALVAGGWEPVEVSRRQHSLGWHGNALLVRVGMVVRCARALDLPTLEPRGAVIADLEVDGRCLRVVGMHLDLSGLWRRRQLRTILDAVHDGGGQGGADGPAVMMGDMNQWTDRGCLTEFGPGPPPAPYRPLLPRPPPCGGAGPDRGVGRSRGGGRGRPPHAAGGQGKRPPAGLGRPDPVAEHNALADSCKPRQDAASQHEAGRGRCWARD